MDHLAASLSAARQNQPFSIQVFAHSEVEEALTFVNSLRTPAPCLIVIGHSWGGDVAIDFASEVGFDIDLLIQIDSVRRPTTFFGGSRRPPTSVKRRLNYFQRGDWPEGEATSTEIPVERAYNVGYEIITHTTIDQPFFGFTEAAYDSHFGSQSDLYARINGEVEVACSR